MPQLPRLKLLLLPLTTYKQSEYSRRTVLIKTVILSGGCAAALKMLRAQSKRVERVESQSS